ncbi:MAG: hypothetical protein AB1486_28255 [Planctomycetota bacterium]
MIAFHPDTSYFCQLSACWHMWAPIPALCVAGVALVLACHVVKRDLALPWIWGIIAAAVGISALFVGLLPGGREIGASDVVLVGGQAFLGGVTNAFGIVLAIRFWGVRASRLVVGLVVAALGYTLGAEGLAAALGNFDPELASRPLPGALLMGAAQGVLVYLALDLTVRRPAPQNSKGSRMKRMTGLRRSGPRL